MSQDKPQTAGWKREELSHRTKRTAESDRRWGPDTAVPDFSQAGQSAGFYEALAELESICGSKSVPLALKGLFTLQNTARKADVDGLQPKFMEKDCFVFNHVRLDRTQIAVLPTRDRYEAIAAMQTHGSNFGVGPGGVIDWIREVDRDEPLTLTGIGANFIEGFFLSAVKSPAKLAEKLIDICPDIVEQGSYDVEGLAREMKTSRRLLFWWD